MEQALEIVKKAVAEYDPERKGKQLKAARALLSAIVSCRRSIEQKAKVDGDSAQKMVRDLEELLGKKPSFRDLTADKADKKDGEESQTPPVAGQQLDLIQNHLKGIVKEQQEAEAAVGREWVKSHPVFNDLKEAIAKSLPKNAYILLFRQKQDNSLELITQAAQDGRIFTRLRPHEFGNEAKLHRIYRGKLRVVGAAVLAEKELLSVFGQVPPPEGNKDQLQTLLGLSSKAAARPATDFMESNEVLKQLNELSHRRKIPKDAYILLFRLNDAQAGKQPEQNPDDDDSTISDELSEADASNGIEAADSDSSIAENLAESASNATEDIDSDENVIQSTADAEIEVPSSDANSSPQENAGNPDGSGEETSTAIDSNNDENSEKQTSSIDDDLANVHSPNAEISTELESSEKESSDIQLSEDQSSENHSTENQLSNDQPQVPELSAAGSSAQAKNAPPPKKTVAPIEYLDWGAGELVTRISGDGKIITRFWPADFVVKHKVYDTFRGKPAIVGAAVIKHSQLFQAIGRLPRPEGGKSALEAVLQMSRSAVEKPVLDYLADNEILKNLYELANATPKREGEVVLFTVTEQGRADIMPMITSSGQSRAKIPLSEFQSPKAVHDRFASREKVAGASVIGEEQSFKNRPPQAGGKAPPERSPDRSNRRDSAPPTRQVVFAAFGRTPLKTNLMCTPETLKRLGVNLF